MVASGRFFVRWAGRQRQTQRGCALVSSLLQRLVLGAGGMVQWVKVLSTQTW